jgi:hypothetical protein
MKGKIKHWLANKYNLRYSNELSKQLLYLRARKHVTEVEQGIGIDVGCNKMHTYPVFKTDEYIGVDLTTDSLIQGLKRYDNAKAINCNLQKLSKKGDMVCCLQMIGVNANFDESYESTLDAVSDLINVTATGGELVFNVGGESMEYKEEITTKLQQKFERVVFESINFPDYKTKPRYALPISLLGEKRIIPSFRNEPATLLFVASNRKKYDEDEKSSSNNSIVSDPEQL